MAEQIAQMEAAITNVMHIAEDIAGRTALAQVREARIQRELAACRSFRCTVRY